MAVLKLIGRILLIVLSGLPLLGIGALTTILLTRKISESIANRHQRRFLKHMSARFPDCDEPEDDTALRIAYRYAVLGVYFDKAVFRSLTRHHFFDIESSASCELDHSAPLRSCTCGYYAARNISDLYQAAAGALKHLSVHQGSIVLLRVMLTGTIVVTDLGYRAENQEVLGAYHLMRCTDCNGTAVALEIVPSVYHGFHWLAAKCAECQNEERSTYPKELLDRQLKVEVEWIS
jgi:hypothetical protein